MKALGQGPPPLHLGIGRGQENLLLASAYAEVQRRGSLTEGLQFDGSALSQLAQALVEGPSQSVVLEVISAGVSDSADPVVVTIQASP